MHNNNIAIKWAVKNGYTLIDDLVAGYNNMDTLHFLHLNGQLKYDSDFLKRLINHYYQFNYNLTNLCWYYKLYKKEIDNDINLGIYDERTVSMLTYFRSSNCVDSII